MRSFLSWLDLKLGLRMLVKYPSLSIVGGIGIAVATAVSVGFFAFVQAHLFPTLPLPDGDRIVAIENRDSQLYNEVRETLHDFVIWRKELRTITDLGAFRMARRNVIASDGAPEPVAVAEITAAGFTVARVAPLIGRYLNVDDEASGARPVLVIGAKVWKDRFASDPNIVGRQIRLDGIAHTIVGVMPEGFAFPFNHAYWTPFRADPSAYARRKGPAIFVFGRLAPGVSMAAAQAELAVLGKRAAADFPATNNTLVPMVMPYAHTLTEGVQGTTKTMAAQMQAMMSLLLVVVALNVAVLVYARTATRQGEIAVRTTLGASRGRIVRQLFLEGLMLSLVSSSVGLVLAQFGLRLANGIMETSAASYGSPFWASYRLQPLTVVFTIGVAVFTAVIVGVLPALQATGRKLQRSLREVSSRSGVRLGATWTTLIVAQVAIAAAALPAAVSIGWDEIRNAATKPTFPASEFLATELRAGETDADGKVIPIDSIRFGQRVADIMRRVAEEPNVVGVTYGASLAHRIGRIEVEGVTLPPDLQGEWAVESEGIAPNSPETFGVRTLAGRGFEPGDTDPASTAIVVSQSFARRVFGNASALGQRVRYAAREAFGGDAAMPPSRWYTIVGVVGDMAVNPMDPKEVAPVIYYPVALGQTTSVELRIRLRDKATNFVPTLRKHIGAVDPAMRISQSRWFDELETQNQFATRLTALMVGLVLVSVALLSAAGVYALTSFTVTRRRREIGIRAALGAGRSQVLRDIFSRIARQIALGLTIGTGSAAVIDAVSQGAFMGGRGRVLLPIFGALMTIVAIAAAVGPARRGLRIDPAEALRADA